MSKKASLPLRLVRFACGAGALWLFIWVISPMIVRNSDAVAHYGAMQDIYGIHSGALYYNDVDAAQEAEFNSRNSFRFMPKGPEGAAQ
ncbi:MAG: hypothetical protein R3Y11_05440 [Pseudomonadota bacterium]